MTALFRILPIALLLGACCPAPTDAPEMSAPEPAKPDPENYIYLYARLHESQPKAGAEAQYLEKIRNALADYESTIKIEEIRGTDNTVEFIGIDMKIAAPESETDSLETLLMNTLRLSGAPYATQIFIVTP